MLLPVFLVSDRPEFQSFRALFGASGGRGCGLGKPEDAAEVLMPKSAASGPSAADFDEVERL
jgi:hypothetical protein